jgi:hypothetical protein
MPIDDPGTWKETAGAIKVAFDAFRSAIGMVRAARRSSSEPRERW